MRFWIHEIAGWLLVGLGLLVFYLCFAMLLNLQILEAGPMTVIGIILFRGGIQLLKVAVAARVCMDTQKRLAGETAGMTAAARAKLQRPATAIRRP